MSERRKFSRLLAWHLWTATGRNFIRADEVPDSLLRSVVASHISQLNSLRRELIVGSALEFKPPDVIYFPHRSLQEFLVAEHVSKALDKGEFRLADAESALTPEVLSFLRSIVSDKGLINLIPEILRHHGSLPLEIEKFYLQRPAVRTALRSRVEEGVKSLWPGLFELSELCEALQEQRIQFHDDSPLFKRIETLVSIGSKGYLIVGMHALLVVLFRESNSESEKQTEGVQAFVAAMQSFLRLETFRMRNSKGREHLLGLLNDISIYEEHGPKRLNLGRLRKSIVEFYKATNWLRTMFEGEHLSKAFRFPSEIRCESAREIDGFRDFRRRIELMRL